MEKKEKLPRKNKVNPPKVAYEQESLAIRSTRATMKALPISLSKQASYERLLIIQEAALTRLEEVVKLETRCEVLAAVYRVVSESIKQIESDNPHKRDTLSFFESLANKVLDDTKEYTDYQEVTK